MNQEAPAHPTPMVYAKVAVALCLITLIEFWAFYIDWLKPYFVPLLIILSLIKFVLVVMYYMHLKFDTSLYTYILVISAGIAFLSGGLLVWLFVFSHPLGV